MDKGKNVIRTAVDTVKAGLKIVTVAGMLGAVAVGCSGNNGNPANGGGGGGTFIDARDGQQYRTVVIGGKTWLAENLNYKPSTGNSWCYANNDDNCAKYGRLYDWNTAMAGSSSSNETPSGIQGVCPEGWHLPSRGEWGALAIAAGGNGTWGQRDSGATKLKSTSGWYSVVFDTYGNGTDDFGFSALPGGFRDNGFYGANISAQWWTATQYSGVSAYHRSIYHDVEHVIEDWIEKIVGYSVRCVQNLR